MPSIVFPTQGSIPTSSATGATPLGMTPIQSVMSKVDAGMSVRIASLLEAERAISSAGMLIFTNMNTNQDGSYLLRVGAANLHISIRRGLGGELHLSVREESTGNLSTRIVPPAEVFSSSPQQLLAHHFPQMLTEIAVFLRLEYVGP